MSWRAHRSDRVHRQSVLNRSGLYDQLLNFDPQLVEVPIAFFRQPVDGEAQDALLLLVQMADLNTGDAIEPVKLGRFKARLAVEDDVLLADEDGIAEAKLGDRRCDLSHMSRVELADLLGRRPNLVERQVSQLEMRK